MKLYAARKSRNEFLVATAEQLEKEAFKLRKDAAAQTRQMQQPQKKIRP